MSIHFLVAIVGTLIAAVGTGVLVSRCLRAPNAVLLAWTVAIFGLTVSLAAQAVGYELGFGPIAFRAMEIGAQGLAPLALAFGLTELAGKTIISRFAARLALTAVAIVALVILAIDPLGAAAFTKAWPPATVYYQIVPNKLLEFVLAPITAAVAVVTMAVIASRPGRDPAWRDAFPAAAPAGIAVLLLAVPSVIALLGLSLPVASAFTPLCAIAAACTWLAGVRAARVQLGQLHQEAGGDDGADETGEWGLQRSWSGGSERTGEFGRVATDDEFGIYRPRDGTSRVPGDGLDYQGANGHGQFADDSGYRQDPDFGDRAGFPGRGRQDEPAFPGRAGVQDQTGLMDGPDLPGDPGYAGEPAFQNSGHRAPGGYPPDYPDHAAPAASHEPPQPLFGQIAIYTLLEDRVEDFDQLTKKVVKRVRAQEPDTLVYIVHAVPSAPMQRILYEVYRDRDAYEAHKRQPYVLAFEADRRPFVLATNIIELGLQQAKVSPLPSVSDLLQDTGFDLLNDTGFGLPGYGPRPPAPGPRAGAQSNGDPLAGSGPHRYPRASAGSNGDPLAGSGPHRYPRASAGSNGDPLAGSGPHRYPRASAGSNGDPLAGSGAYPYPTTNGRPYGDPLAGDGPIGGGTGPRRLR
jgi:quinol monooxygenase YgiN